MSRAGYRLRRQVRPLTDRLNLTLVNGTAPREWHGRSGRCQSGSRIVALALLGPAARTDLQPGWKEGSR